MQRLPPLNAIKAFEAAARAGNFTLAALELGVSSAAISQQIRNLEAWFGKQLFVRSGNRITLTDAGHAIYPHTSRALGDLAAVATRILEGEPRTRLAVSAPISLAESWLSPKLVKLLETYPRMSIDIRVEEDPIDMARQNIDLRISYGDYHYPGLKSFRLLHDEVLPVCAPAFRLKYGGSAFDLATLHDSMFIHTNWGPNYASHPTWADWFAEAGGSRHPDPSLGRRVGLSILAVSSARMGLGVALGQTIMARSDLEAGRLVAVSPIAVRLGHSYCAFVSPAKADRAELRNLIGLLSEDGPMPGIAPRALTPESAP